MQTFGVGSKGRRGTLVVIGVNFILFAHSLIEMGPLWCALIKWINLLCGLILDSHSIKVVLN